MDEEGIAEMFMDDSIIADVASKFRWALISYPMGVAVGVFQFQ